MERPHAMASDVRLEPLTSADFPVIRHWIDTRVFRIFREPLDETQLESLLTKYQEQRPTSLGFRIVRVSDSEIVGFIHALIRWDDNLAHVGQIVVGDPGLRCSGIGTASLLQLLEICFAELGLHRVQIFVDEDNLPAISCYRKAGFRDEGLMRDATRTDKGYVSWHSMSILEEEWRGI